MTTKFDDYADDEVGPRPYKEVRKHIEFTKLNISGKDVPTWDVICRKEIVDGHMKWQLAGDYANHVGDQSRQTVLRTLYQWQGTSPTRAELHASAMPNYNRTSFYKLVDRMMKDGLLSVERNRVLLTQDGGKAAKALGDSNTPF